MRNTQFDRPSASRHDYGYIYKENGHFYIDLNVQIRFKSITAASKEVGFSDEMINRITRYAKELGKVIDG